VGPDGLRYVEREPAFPLRRFVRRLWALETPAGAPPPPEDLVLPDGCAEAVLHHGDGFERRSGSGVATTYRHAFVGQIVRALSLRPLGRVGCVGVRFEPAGARALLGVRASDVTERSVPLEDLPSPAARALVRAVSGEATVETRLLAAERVLSRACAALPSRPTLAERASAALVGRGGRARLSDLCADLGAAGRRLERRFHDEVGVPPKVLARIVRFQSAVRRLRTRRARTLADAALDCGYCDQSHLTRDFREFAGAAPAGWLGERHLLAEAFLR
jgi:AraC-like DNA-binding protein